MSSQGEKDKRDKTKSRPAAAGAPESAAGRKRTAPSDVGKALRSAYQRTIDEEIPPEMLDLLGRLT